MTDDEILFLRNHGCAAREMTDMQTSRRNIFSTAAAWIAALFGYRAADAASFERQYQKAMRFIEGEQWDAEIRQIRESHGRPVLVFNRVLCIFQRKAYDAKLVRGSQAWKELAVNVYRKTADTQRCYNYWRSNEAELLQRQDDLFFRPPFAAITAQCEKLAKELSA